MPSDKNEGWEVEGKSKGIEKKRKMLQQTLLPIEIGVIKLTNHNSNN